MLSNKIDIATIVALMSLLLTTRASETATNSSSGIIIVVVSIDVLRSIVSPIIGEAGEVYSIVSGAVEPHSFTLTLEAVNIALRSDLIVITGHMEWEKKLVNLVAEEKGVSPDLISVNAMNLSWIKILDLNGERNIHGFWLLPENALLIAEEVKEKISRLRPDLSARLSDNYERFRRNVLNLKAFLSELSARHGTLNRRVVIGFYAEHYVAEAMGLKACSVLVDEGGTVRPGVLNSIYKGFKSGEYACLIVSDVALLMEEAQRTIKMISEETGCPIAYILSVSSGRLEDYTALMYYNAGQIYNALLSERRIASRDNANIYLLTILVLLLTVIFESVLLIKRRVGL